MKTHSVARRISALVLVAAVSVIGVPLPTTAAAEGGGGVSRHRQLTVDGRSLSKVLTGPAIAWSGILPAGRREQESGQISGVALDGVGQPVAAETVHLRHVGPPTEVVATTTTDPNGRFSFATLGQGRYIVDLGIAGKVVATSGLFSLAEGGMTFTQVGGIPAQQSSSDDGHGKGGLFWAAVGAGVGAGVGSAACHFDPTASDPSNLCWGIVPFMGAITGAFSGLMFGAGR